MPGTPRDLLKTRSAKLGEVLTLNHYKAGQANSQAILFGCVVTPLTGTPDHLTMTAGEVLLAQAVVEVSAKADIVPAAPWTTAAGQFRKVLGEVDASGNLTWTVGNVATSQEGAEVPALDPAKIAVVVLEIPASFTADTTSFTTAMIKRVAYHGDDVE